MSSLSSVLIVSDVRLYRDGLVMFLSAGAPPGAVESCADDRSARARVVARHFAAVCIDCGMQGALELAQHLIAEQITVVVMGLNNEAHAAVHWLDQGVSGYVCKDASIDDLIGAIDSAIRSKVVCSREVAGMLCRRLMETGAREQMPWAELTSRELQIGFLLEKGWNNKRIANHLRIAISTTKNHVHSILEKLGASSRLEAAAILRRGDGTLAASRYRERISMLRDRGRPGKLTHVQNVM